MAVSRTTIEVLQGYMYRRLEQINPNAFQSSELLLSARIASLYHYQEPGPTKRFIDSVAQNLDEMETVGAEAAVPLVTTSLGTAARDRRGALERIFVVRTITWSKILTLLEFAVNQMAMYLEIEDTLRAFDVFTWLVDEFTLNPIGVSGSTLDNWVINNGGWDAVNVEQPPPAAAIVPLKPASFVPLRVETADLWAEDEAIEVGAEIPKAVGAVRQFGDSVAKPVHRPTGFSGLYSAALAPVSSSAVPAPFPPPATANVVLPGNPVCGDGCGQPKTKIMYQLKGTCPKCGKQWCLEPHCNVEYRGRNAHRILQRHIVRDHLRGANPNMCFHCKGIKVRFNQKYGQCPLCGVFWCFIKECTFEHDIEGYMKRHSNRCTGHLRI